LCPSLSRRGGGSANPPAILSPLLVKEGWREAPGWFGGACILHLQAMPASYLFIL
jgi:hypothetical protein